MHSKSPPATIQSATLPGTRSNFGSEELSPHPKSNGLTMHRLILGLVLILTLGASSGQDLQLPLKADSLRFAVIGDSGTGGDGQRQIGARMAEYRVKFPFEMVLMLGDNIYGRK